MPLHPQVEGLLAQMREAAAPPISSLPVAEARSGAANLIPLGGQPAAVASVRDTTMPVDGGEIALRVYTPLGDGPHPATLFFHGGGWVICDLDTHDPMARDICAGSHSVVVSVDYRMAPEHKFPTAPYDCFAAFAVGGRPR